MPFIVNTLIQTIFSYDELKDLKNREKHGLSLAEAAELEWDTALAWDDLRKDYRERRQYALVLKGDRLYAVVFTDRAGANRRLISLRKANRREVRRYVDHVED